jgi:hypothetical protein
MPGLSDRELPYGKVFTMARRMASQNQFQYKHWRSYTAERDAWWLLIRSQLPPRSAAPDHPVRLRLHSFRTRLVDYANLVGGAKPIPDVLIRLGYLKDDSPRWFHCDYFQTVVPKAQERTELTFLPWAAGDIEEALDA